MSAFEGLRDWEPAERPWLLVIRDAIGLLLTMVAAVSLTLLMYAVISP